MTCPCSGRAPKQKPWPELLEWQPLQTGHCLTLVSGPAAIAPKPGCAPPGTGMLLSASRAWLAVALVAVVAAVFKLEMDQPPAPIVVVGGGLAGAVAALTAGQGGRAVVLLEKQPKPGEAMRLFNTYPYLKAIPGLHALAQGGTAPRPVVASPPSRQSWATARSSSRGTYWSQDAASAKRSWSMRLL